MNWVFPSSVMIILAWLLLTTKVTAEERFKESCPASLNFTFKRLGEARTEHLCEAYKGKLILVVNTASKCAFTPQYDGLEKLYRRYKDRGLVILGFPSNDFAGQEPGTEKQILNFCRLTYSVEFPMFEKVHAAQSNADPFYQSLAKMSGEYPAWNFHKYFIAPDGKLLGSFKSHVKPDDHKIDQLIKENLPHG